MTVHKMRIQANDKRTENKNQKEMFAIMFSPPVNYVLCVRCSSIKNALNCFPSLVSSFLMAQNFYKILQQIANYDSMLITE